MHHPNKAIVSLTMHSDPAHGWLEVPRSLATQLGILPKISRYSYVLGGLLFLEGDLDAELAIAALREKGYPFEIQPQYYTDFCDIPRLHCFSR